MNPDWKCVRCGLPGCHQTSSGFEHTARHRDTHGCLMAAVKEIRSLQERVVHLEAEADQ